MPLSPRLQNNAFLKQDSVSKLGVASVEVDDKKKSMWAKYQTLIVKYPFTMQLVQSGILTAAGNATAQLVTGATSVALGPLVEQVILSVCFIAPIVACWIPFLSKMQLHWTLSTFVDQFLFSPIFNIGIFTFLSAAFGGGLTLKYTEFTSASCSDGFFKKCAPGDERYDLLLTLRPSVFPAVMSYAPVWSTLASSYYVWLPATIMREKFVPPYLKGPFVLIVSFVWNIIFAIILSQKS